MSEAALVSAQAGPGFDEVLAELQVLLSLLLLALNVAVFMIFKQDMHNACGKLLPRQDRTGSPVSSLRRLWPSIRHIVVLKL